MIVHYKAQVYPETVTGSSGEYLHREFIIECQRVTNHTHNTQNKKHQANIDHFGIFTVFSCEASVIYCQPRHIACRPGTSIGSSSSLSLHVSCQ